MLRVVGMGDLQASTQPGDVLVTYALGSCIGITAWDPRAKAGGLLHFMLPESTINPGRAQSQPGMFADTGIQALLRRLTALGASPQRLVIKLAGGSSLGGGSGYFDIGRRNLLAAKRLLWKQGLGVDAEETGGSAIRTLRLEIESGRALLREGSHT